MQMGGGGLLQILVGLSVAAVTTDQSSAVLWRWEMCFESHRERDELALQTYPYIKKSILILQLPMKKHIVRILFSGGTIWCK